MTTNKQTASNAAVRALLTLLGEKRDLEVLGLAPGELRDKKIKARLREEFKGRCAYCEKKIAEDDGHIDHIVPINRESAGLHMLGNLALACSSCNSAKHRSSLDEFLTKYKIPNAELIKSKLNRRAKDLGATLDSSELKDFVNSLYAEISNLVSARADKALSLLPKPTKTTLQVAREIQKKTDFDFSEIAELFPLGCWVVAKLDEKVGEVVDYSLQGDKGKRKPYVTFISVLDGKAYRRSPNQLRRLKKPNF